MPAGHTLTLDSLSLLQTADVLESRGPSAEQFTEYVKALVKEGDSLLAGQPDIRASTGDLVVVVKPGGRSRVWCEFSDDAMSTGTKKDLAQRLEKVNPPPAVGGPLAFSVKVNVRGGAPARSLGKPQEMNIPQEWKAAVQRHGSPAHVDQIIQLVWPD